MLTKSMTTYQIFALTSVTILSLIHYISMRLEKAKWLWHGRFLSFASGVSIAYVFIELLPKLSLAQQTVNQGGLLPFFEKHVYVLALVGLLVFYVVEQYNTKQRGLFNGLSSFWLSMACYGLFNFLVGYAISDQNDPEIQPLALFTFAIGLHVFINDHALFEAHSSAYEQLGRSIVVALLLLGYFIGLSTSLPATAVALIVSFIGGGMIMNVFHHELPLGYRPHAMKPFLFGSITYGLILLFIG